MYHVTGLYFQMSSYRSELLYTKFLPFSSYYHLEPVDLNFKPCNYSYSGNWISCFRLFAVVLSFSSSYMWSFYHCLFSVHNYPHSSFIKILFDNTVFWNDLNLQKNGSKVKISWKFLIHATFFSKWLQLYYYYDNPQLSLIMNDSHLSFQNFYFEYFLS